MAVVGGGNVAMDAARTAKRLGAENVYIIYRRGMAELPARKEEVEHAEEEGIIFHTLTNPVEILLTTSLTCDLNRRVAGIRCVKMELREPDASGRRSLIGPLRAANSIFRWIALSCPSVLPRTRC